MRHILRALTILVTLASSSGARELNFGDVGVYAADFEFCSMSIVKVPYMGDSTRPERLQQLRDRLKKNVADGRTNVLGLYTFDRVTYTIPLQDVIANTNAVLDAVDVTDLHAVFLAEENVTWNNGLAMLNGLYEHIKSRSPQLPVYQWLTSPDGPSPTLKADGWLYDHYGQHRASFRRKLAEYVITGKPVVMCLNVSPDVALCDSAAGGRLSREQWEVCREFNIPIFYYCVDLRWGNPAIWWHSNDAELTRWRTWLLETVDETRGTDISALPRRSADYTDAVSVEAAPDEEGRFVMEEDFAGADFLRRMSTRGFLNLQWDGPQAQLTVGRRSAAFRQTELYVHIVSDFAMKAPQATLTLGPGTQANTVGLMLSATGHNWPHAARNDEGQLSITAAATEDPGFAGRAFWIRIVVDAGEALGASPRAILQRLRFECDITPPEQPGITLLPDDRGLLCFSDGFASAKYRWLARIDGADAITWRPGEISIHGVEGRANSAVLRWPVRCEPSVTALRVVLQAQANGPNLGATTVLGISLDGEAPLVSASTQDIKADQNGWQNGDLSLDLTNDARFSGVSQFWVHAKMVNGCGIKTNPSNRITGLSIEGTPVTP